MNALPIPEVAIRTAWPTSGLPVLRTAAILLCKEAGEYFGVEVSDIRARRRAPPHVRARHWVWQELRRAGYSFPAIAREFGVDHSSVQYACAKNAEVAQLVERPAGGLEGTPGAASDPSGFVSGSEGGEVQAARAGSSPALRSAGGTE